MVSMVGSIGNMQVYIVLEKELKSFTWDHEVRGRKHWGLTWVFESPKPLHGYTLPPTRPYTSLSIKINEFIRAILTQTNIQIIKTHSM